MTEEDNLVETAIDQCRKAGLKIDRKLFTLAVQEFDAIVLAGTGSPPSNMEMTYFISGYIAGIEHSENS